MEAPRRRQSLSNRILRLTLLIGVSTLLVAAVVSVLVTSRTTSRVVTAHDLETLQAAEDTIEARVAIADDALARASRGALVPDGAVRREALRTALNSTGGVADAIIVCDESGRVLAQIPEGARSWVPTAAIQAAHMGRHAFVTRDAADRLVLLISRVVPTADGSSLVVTARVRPGSFESVVQAAATKVRSGTAVLSDAGAGVVLAAYGAPLQRDKMEWVNDPGSPSGQLRATTTYGRSLYGPFTSVDGVEGLRLRLAVIEPGDSTLRAAVEVAWPTLLVMVIGGSVALVFAWVVSRRLVVPLHELEAAALRGAAGAYVKPIAVTRDDEIGRVAEAFNAVSLRLNALHDLSQLLASGSQLDQVLDGILAATAHIVGPSVTAVYLLDSSGSMLVPAAAKGSARAEPMPVPARGDGWLASVLVSAEPSAYDLPMEMLSDELPGLLTDPPQAAIAAPLIVGNESLGVVVAVPQTDRVFSEAEIEMLRTFSAQAGLAVKNSRLFIDEADSRRAAETLRDIAEALVRPVTLGQAFHRTEEALCELLGAKWVRIAPVDRDEIGLHEPRGTGESELLAAALRRLKGHAEPRPVIVSPAEDDAVRDILAQVGGSSLLIAPIALSTEHGAVLGVALDTDTVSSADSEVLAAVCSELALALDNAYFYDRALNRADSLERVFRISQVVSSSLQVNVVLNRVLDVVQKIFSADAVVLMTYDAARRRIVTDMARGQVSPTMVDLEVKPGEDIPGYVFATSEPASLSDLQADSAGVGGDAAGRGLRSLMAVPLVAREKSIGVLMVFSTEVAAFKDEDLRLLLTFAAQAALAIDTARVYSREHEVSQILQNSILPEKLPSFPEVETGTNYIPAASPAAEIGGDYYDAIRAPDGRLLLAIADVCGKGIVAATKTSMIKYSVRALIAAGLSPAEVMADVNRIVCESGTPGDIVTLWVGALDVAGGKLTWANGGHPPVLLRRVDGSVERLGATGPLLGAVPEIAYEELEVPIEAGDVVLLYTDGVTEARSGNKLFGEERLRRTLEDPGSAAEIADRVLDAVRRYVRGDLRDDVAILAAKVSGAANAVDRDKERQE